MLLNFCKANQLFIVNTKKCSRIGVRDDKGIGRLACRNYSTADYCISSSYFLKSVVNFTVQDFNCLFSTVQCPPAISFSCNSVKVSLSESSVSLEDSILFWKSNCLLTSHFLILATPLFSILSGLVLSLTELHENEIAGGHWTVEKRQLKSCTVKFTTDFKKYELLIQ
jgi:hypothetical protein